MHLTLSLRNSKITLCLLLSIVFSHFNLYNLIFILSFSYLILLLDFNLELLSNNFTHLFRVIFPIFQWEPSFFIFFRVLYLNLFIFINATLWIKGVYPLRECLIFYRDRFCSLSIILKQSLSLLLLFLRVELVLSNFKKIWTETSSFIIYILKVLNNSLLHS